MREARAVIACEIDDSDLRDARFKLWGFALAAIAFGFDEVLFTDHYERESAWSNFQAHSPGFPVTYVSSLDGLKRVDPLEIRVVCVEPTPDAVPLSRFEHPHRAVYLFGRDHGFGLRPNEWPSTAAFVEIESERSVYAFQAATIVARDRYLQSRSEPELWDMGER